MNDIQFRAHAIAIEWLRDRKDPPPMPFTGERVKPSVESYTRAYLDAYGKALRELEKHSIQ